MTILTVTVVTIERLSLHQTRSLRLRPSERPQRPEADSEPDRPGRRATGSEPGPLSSGSPGPGRPACLLYTSPSPRDRG
eukprot:1072043-Rhodomonas_salina.1